MFPRLRKFVDAAFKRERFERQMADEMRFYIRLDPESSGLTLPALTGA